MSHEMPQVLSSRDTSLVISTNEYKSAPRSLEKDRPLSSRHRNSYPLGAHTAGFYSKHRSSTIHSGINVPTVNAMLRDMDLLSQSRVQQRDQASPQLSSQPTRTNTVVGNITADTCSSEEFTQGLGLSMRRESHSARYKRVSVSQPVQNDALLGAALLTLIPRAIAWPDVLANINILVNVIVTENPYLEMKIRTEKNTGEIPQGLPSDTFINSSIVRDSSLWTSLISTPRLKLFKACFPFLKKIEILLEIISCISLDLSLDDAVEQLINDASRLADCELVLFYLVDRETDELVAYEAHSMSMDSCEREVMGKANFHLAMVLLDTQHK
ncbi:hypothetical protein BASA61_002430 [Batrachochytrium salamandrivorans]|nr:hypothetical protein BASA61_002430 [Batrachochytrium salamandrivorans]